MTKNICASLCIVCIDFIDKILEDKKRQNYDKSVGGIQEKGKYEAKLYLMFTNPERI
jgi:hypothetical protein